LSPALVLGGGGSAGVAWETIIARSQSIMNALSGKSPRLVIERLIGSRLAIRFASGDDGLTTMASARTFTTIAALRGVTKVFGSGEAAVHALEDIDLEIAPGELLVVLGPSGSGKTTLLNILGGIEPSTTGTVQIAGHDVTRLGPAAMTRMRRDVVGFVYQFFNLIPTLTARENIAVLAELTGGDVAARSTEVLAAVGLDGHGERFPGQMSGGQQQRVAIARALVNSPHLLLCDEPTGALDADTGQTILGLLQRLSRSDDRAVVIVTHNVAIAPIANRVVRMRSGRIIEQTRNDRPIDAREVSW
jgi:putative ABC transport system ATP-binding protein